jgi:probable DNA metabolism protein
MLAFRYDNTFEGLLSAVFDAYTRKEFPEYILGPEETPPLLASSIHAVMTSRPKADRVFAGLGKRLTRIGKNSVLLAFLSEEAGTATLLFRYMRKVFDSPLGKTPETDFADADIFAVDQLARKVYADHHLLLGFARFQKTAEGIYFAALSPKYNVLSLLLPHFKDRFSAHPWIIYDARRGFGFHHENGIISDMILEGDILTDGRLPAHLLAQGEEFFQKMWEKYLASATITERINRPLQARCLPRRFWPHMTEKEMLTRTGF